MRDISDEDYALQAKARAKMLWRFVWALLGVSILAIGTLLAASSTGYKTFITRADGQIIFAGLLGLLFLIGLAGLAKYSPHADVPPHLLRRHIDRHQRRWRNGLCGCILAAIPIVASLNSAVEDLSHYNSIWTILGAGAGLFGIVLFGLMLAAGPGWSGLRSDLSSIINDEFTLALRARTMRIGYLTMMLVLVAIIFTAALNPNLVISTSCWGLYAGFAVPALYYIIADWRSEGGNAP